MLDPQAPGPDGRVPLLLRSGAPPTLWGLLECVVAGPRAPRMPPRFFLKEGARLVAAQTLLLEPFEGRLRTIIKLPAEECALSVEPAEDLAVHPLGPVRIERLGMAEAAARIALRIAVRDGPAGVARTSAAAAKQVARARGSRLGALKQQLRALVFPMTTSGELTQARARKLERLRPFLRTGLPHRWAGDKLDFLTGALRAETGLADTENVSANDYDADALALIDACRDGLVLDCGAGRRSHAFDNVINLEIVDYDSTDVLAVGEELPFQDGTFDGVLSLAVLEHVRDPFRCAAELARVLKPGGKLICCVPFLQPLHGYPHHYFNMTHQGLRALFERTLTIDRQVVADSTGPVWSLTAFVQAWARGLPADERERFLDLPLRTFLKPAEKLLREPYVHQLREAQRFELASATLLFATKAATKAATKGATKGR